MLLPITPVADPAAHAVGDVAPAAHAEPAGHESHADRPDCDWYRPASHREHTALPVTAELWGRNAGLSTEQMQRLCVAAHHWPTDFAALGTRLQRLASLGVV